MCAQHLDVDYDLMKLICGKYVGVGSVQYACSYTDVND